MNPKKSKHIVKKVAQDMSLPEEMVDDLYSFYWEQVRKHISNIDYPDITIDNLGSFQLKPMALDRTIYKYQNHINKFDKTTFKSFPLYEKMQARLSVLEKAKKTLDEEKETKKQFKHGKKSNKDLEGQGENPGGN